MYVSARDPATGVTVGVFTGTLRVDAEYLAVMNDLLETNRLGRELEGPSVFALVVSAERPPPPPVWRKRFSELNLRLSHAPHYMLMVTTSAVSRGAFTAVNWVTGTPPGHTYRAMRTATDADRWLTDELGKQFAAVTRLERQARSGDLQTAKERARA